MQLPTVPQPTYQIFKCEQSSPPGIPKPSCVKEDNKSLYNYIGESLMKKGLMGPVQLIRTSCLGRCIQGAVMQVVSQNERFMYTRLTEERIDRILDEHIKGGKPVEEFLIEENFWGEPAKIS
jgi:(2Fe-2S) ferredoxin